MNADSLKALHEPHLPMMGWVLYSPWQRGSNENINGLIRQYLPKGTDLLVYSQEQLNAIAYELNIRPRKRFNWKCPIEVMTEVVALQHDAPASIQ